MTNRLVNELESYDGYDGYDDRADEVIADVAPEIDFNTYEVVVQETVEYRVRVQAKNMATALWYVNDMKDNITKNIQAEKYTFSAYKSPYALNEDGSCDWETPDYDAGDIDVTEED